ncbi:hypothetical protein C8R43DRAFT_1013446 [Mycena crocata]|nr:hypothetical protein C8R43DRAFT_1013446 [Mycena crocata]
MSSIHAVRGKKWGANSFVAEWFANAVAYCQSEDGGKAFQDWLVETYGKDDARKKLLDCQKPPLKRYGLPALGNRNIFNSAALEFGISDEAMEQYHLFTGGLNICVPPRMKPAPKRRRGETSAEWLARRHAALLEGCKSPDIDWRHARVMAISEFDKARDTYEVWHTDIHIFLECISKRAESALLVPDYVGKPEEPAIRLADAFSSSLHAVTLSYMTWGHAVDLFEELDRRGLASTSAIERAYKHDSALMWRLVACLCKVTYMAGHFWERFTQIMSWCEYYRPYFRRYAGPSGESRIEIDRTYLKQRGGCATVLDNTIIESIATDAPATPAFFDNVLKYLDHDPSEARKFSSTAYEELGDMAIVQEFRVQLFESAFGARLIEYAKSQDDQCLKDPNFLPCTTFMDPSKLRVVTRGKHDWAYARTLARSQGSTWLSTTNKTTMLKFFIQPSINTLDYLLRFDQSWLDTDAALWSMAGALDRKGDRGTVARHFGLFNPTDPARPTCTATILNKSRTIILQRAPSAPATAAPPASVDLRPIVSSDVVSGYTYMAGTKHLRAEKKVKTKGAETALAEETAAPDEEEDETLPDFLPEDFKMGKKLLKVFHRILEAPDFAQTDDESAGAKKGQIRWAEFERAMKRIGFRVCPTGGSSVRFDPPAKTAHPITFHRPHPDSVLTPNLLRWIGARLKRCYGWTTATFERGSTDVED